MSQEQDSKLTGHLCIIRSLSETRSTTPSLCCLLSTLQLSKYCFLFMHQRQLKHRRTFRSCVSLRSCSRSIAQLWAFVKPLFSPHPFGWTSTCFAAPGSFTMRYAVSRGAHKTTPTPHAKTETSTRYKNQEKLNRWGCLLFFLSLDRLSLEGHFTVALPCVQTDRRSLSLRAGLSCLRQLW